MTPQEAFKLGFLARCVEENLPQEKIAEAADAFNKLAAHPLLEAILSGAKGVISPAFRYGTYAALAAPPAIGAGAAYFANKASEPDSNELKELQNSELLDEYAKATQQLQQQAKLREYKKERTRPKNIYL